MKNTKFFRTMLTVALVLTIIGSVTGGTIAWFTDSVESTNNIIKSGNLDMVVEYKTDLDDEWATLEEDTELFNKDALYEPGYTEVVFLRVANAGNLAFKYNLALSVEDSVIGKSVLGNDIELSKYLDMGIYVQDEYSSGANYADILMPVMFSDRATALSKVATSMTKLSTKNAEGLVTLATDSPILPGDQTSQVVALVLTMPTTVGNEANHLTGTAAPEITLGLHVQATQYMHESDSFGSDYDEDATYPEISSTPIKATVTALSGDELTIMCTDAWQGAMGLTFLDGEQVLDCGLKLTAQDTPADIVGKDYADWSVDFEISSTKALEESDTTPHIVLAGQYTSWCEDWLAFELAGVGTEANKAERIMSSFARIKYSEIVNDIKEFQCGVILLDDYFKGESITLELCVYETDGHGNELEDGRHVIKSFTFDF